MMWEFELHCSTNQWCFYQDCIQCWIRGRFRVKGENTQIMFHVNLSDHSIILQIKKNINKIKNSFAENSQEFRKFAADVCGVWEEEMLVLLMLATNIFHVKIIRCTFYRNVISLAGQSRASLSWRSNRSTDTAFCSNVPAKYSSTKFILLGISLLYKNITYLRWLQKLCLPQNKI